MNKNIIGILFVAIAGCALVPSALVSCTDMAGDGIDSIEWNGSQNPQNTSFRNPVWEPSLEAGAVYKGASLYVAVSSETQWSKGLNLCCPTITSSDFMNWTYSSQAAFTYGSTLADGTTVLGSRPSWTQARLVSISADFAKTVSGTPYWMVYEAEGENAIGAAYSAGQQGPYTDAGQLLSAAEVGATTLTQPSISVFGVRTYLLYSTEKGSFVQELTLKKSTLPKLKGTPVQVAGPEFKDVTLTRTDNSNYYLVGTVKNGERTEIRYAHGEKAVGPFSDKNGNAITSSGTGELLVQGNDSNINPENFSRMFENADGIWFIAYNATTVGKETMQSGYARRPLFITPLTMGNDGWFESVASPTTGWTTPKFK